MLSSMVRKFTDDPAFDDLSPEAKEAIEEARFLEQHKVTPGVKTEVIWSESEARSENDTQEILEFWLVTEGIDIQNDHEFRTNGKLSTFIYQDFVFNTLILDNVIFPYSKVLQISCYVFAPNKVSIELLEEFGLINHPGRFHIKQSNQSPTGLFVHYDHHIFGEPKSLQFAIGTAMNLSVALASQLIEIWPERFGGEVLEIESLSDLTD
jgi:hypothetical protein